MKNDDLRSSLIVGTYSRQPYIQLDCNEMIKNSEHHRMHELVHFIINKNTYYGIFEDLLGALTEYTNYNFGKIVRELKVNGEIAQENFATFSEISLLYQNNPEEYITYVETLKKEDRYKMYKLYMACNLCELQKESKISREFILDLIFIVFNIPIMGLLSIKWWNEDDLAGTVFNNEDLYSPNVRFERVYDAINSKITRTDEGTLSLEQVVKESIITIEFEEKVCRELLYNIKDVYIKSKMDTNVIDNIIDNFSFHKKEAGEEYLKEYIEGICVPSALNRNYEIVESLTQLPEINTQRLLLYKGRQVMMFDDTMQGKRLINEYSDECVRYYLEKKESELILYYEDYNILLGKYPEIKQRRHFVYLETNYSNAKKLIEPFIEEEHRVILHNLNSEVFYTFYKLKDNGILVIAYDKGGCRLLAEDIGRQIYQYVNIEEGSLIDGVFYLNSTDWTKYEDVLYSISDTYMHHLTMKFKSLGHRVYLK